MNLPGPVRRPSLRAARSPAAWDRGHLGRLRAGSPHSWNPVTGRHGAGERGPPSNVICITHPRRESGDTVSHRPASAPRLSSTRLNRICSTDRVLSNRCTVSASGRTARCVPISPMLRRRASALLCLHSAALTPPCLHSPALSGVMCAAILRRGEPGERTYGSLRL